MTNVRSIYYEIKCLNDMQLSEKKRVNYEYLDILEIIQPVFVSQEWKIKNRNKKILNHNFVFLLLQSTSCQIITP